MRPGKADYRLCRVSRIEEDTKGLVRTVHVKLRRRDYRTKGLPYSGPDLIEMKTAVQRLVVICPTENVPTDWKAKTKVISGGAMAEDIPIEWNAKTKVIPRGAAAEDIPTEWKAKMKNVPAPS